MYFFFFFNDTATTEIYTLSLHDALPICRKLRTHHRRGADGVRRACTCGCTEMIQAIFESGDEVARRAEIKGELRSEEHTSELQSHLNLVCRLLLEKKKRIQAFVVIVRES